MQQLCSNCGRPIGKAAAKGLDSRCYSYQRRHGKLPPVNLLKSTVAASIGRDVRVNFQIDRMTYSDARHLVTTKRTTVGAWLRDMIRLEIARARVADAQW